MRLKLETYIELVLAIALGVIAVRESFIIGIVALSMSSMLACFVLSDLVRAFNEWEEDQSCD